MLVYFPGTGKLPTADATTAARGLGRLQRGGYRRRRGRGRLGRCAARLTASRGQGVEVPPSASTDEHRIDAMER